MESPRTRSLCLALLLATTALAVAPGAQAFIEPVGCVHDIVNMGTCAGGGITPPAPPAGASLVCNYPTEVGGEVHVGANSWTWCYSFDPTTCGTGVGGTLQENANTFQNCVHPGACGIVGENTASSINEANHAICIDSTATCDVQVDFIPAGPVLGPLGFSACANLPSPCGAPAPSPGWGITVGGPCIPMPWVDLAYGPCPPGVIGQGVEVGDPLVVGGPVANFCL